MLRAILWGTLVLALGCQRPPPALTPVTGNELNQLIRTADKTVVVVNLWATWCGPCREEFPDLVKLQREYAGRGVRVIFVSWDMEPATALKFLREQGVDYPTFIKNDKEPDQKFIEALAPQWSGAFPATMIYDRTGALRQFWEGKRTYPEFESAIKTALETQPQGESK